MYKMIVCDMDETLLTDSKQITAENTAAIKAAVEQGVYFVPNTGRNFLTVQDNLQQLGLYQKKDAYVISFNGGAVVENYQNRILLVNEMPFAQVEALFKLGVQAQYCVHVYTLDKLYIWNMQQDEIDYLAGRINGWIDLDKPDISQLRGQRLVKILFSVPTRAERKKVEQVVHEQFSFPLNVTFSSDRYIEFNPVTADKGKASLALGTRLGIKPAEIIAIGDNSNDLAMIQQAGLGVSVQNGRQFVKDVADYIAKRDNNHSAVAEVIEKFVLKHTS
ncbi:Cof-type HAD-IIB family hydrolase [Liquorilactobacillus satsumensis]|nr:Cof-type HAD-IIB family hydrolase [Liquorilactobacillus satsumensis]MCC7666179.1 Cof-type HAD-IIB family hydrolase [Liquorilactobacillus satsumensis]MCP9313398.1 Cof-type HAD-IIB family hydrolase [Liquorilactobacillus satsumensis]MCP9329140.1 Cof-type HAD-IIB family hydrolase [Liquorilactobacillus satsumensis]MCP9357446.1 Cof-type HAD-IIB family hydrolase [Liquorilactobacillus satsumensis]MCP9360094.1 Cof-type HAD-IIB family hydrolase [Liquorilactobacillus satsumensis]